jgi:NhaP-type Na+/H+ or K+/H+ antiporter
MAIGPGILKKLPITSSVIYLLFGLTLGKHGLDIIRLDPLSHSVIIEVVSELTVIISLFTVGLKLRHPLRERLWLIPLSLAGLSMILTVGLIAVIGHVYLGLGIGQSILLGAIISPTDPVLASEVQLKAPMDTNVNKFILTSEGGMNDGTAFPFVMLGLELIGQDSSWTFTDWILKDLIWAVMIGLSIGAICGWAITTIASYVRDIRNSFYLEDFLTIASISLSYGLALQFHSYGFLSVFANALTIRQIELIKSGKSPTFTTKHLPDDVLSFNEQLERIFEIVSVAVVGLLIDLSSFSIKNSLVAISVIFVIRPLAVILGTSFLNLKLANRTFISWFGVRGIGSIYYLYFAINQNKAMTQKEQIINYTLWTILFSIFLHGVSVKLIMKRIKGDDLALP